MTPELRDEWIARHGPVARTRRYTEKPWFFKAGRLNMMSGEPMGLYFKTPRFALALSTYGVHLLS